MKGTEVGVRAGSDADVEAINQGRETLFRAFNATNLDAFVARVADDVVVMGHGGPPPLVGKEAVRSNYKAFFEQMTPNLTPSSAEIVVSRDWAFDRGTWVSIKSDKRGVPRQRLKSCYVMIWRREPAGGWKLARIIVNGADVSLTTRKTAEIRTQPKKKRRK